MGKCVEYYDVKKPTSFSGPRNFPKPVKRWLEETQSTYTLHRPIKKTYPRRRTIVSGMRQQMQADLIDFSALKKYSDGFC